MVKNNSIDDLGLDETVLDTGLPTTPENEFAFDDPIQGEQIDSGIKNYDLFFMTENLLYEIEKNFRGYTKVNGAWRYMSDPIARDEIINQFMNCIRSIVNPIHMTSSLGTEELAFDLLEKITEVIFTIYDEQSIDDDKVEHLINVIDHTIQIFAGHIQNGHGSKFARQMYANVYHEPGKDKNNEKKWYDDFIKWN